MAQQTIELRKVRDFSDNLNDSFVFLKENLKCHWDLIPFDGLDEETKKYDTFTFRMAPAIALLNKKRIRKTAWQYWYTVRWTLVAIQDVPRLDVAGLNVPHPWHELPLNH